ncbi:hypothetical protein D9M68_827030 [compost metagenome]
MLGTEAQGFGPQAGGAVGDGQTHQVGLAGVGELGLDLDGGVDLLSLLVQGEQGFGRFDLGEQGELLLAVDFDLFGLQGQYVAIGTELATWPHGAVVLTVQAGAVGVGAVLSSHFLDPAALDLAAIGGGALNSDPGPLGAVLLGGVVGLAGHAGSPRSGGGVPCVEGMVGSWRYCGNAPCL